MLRLISLGLISSVLMAAPVPKANLEVDENTPLTDDRSADITLQIKDAKSLELKNSKSENSSYYEWNSPFFPLSTNKHNAWDTDPAGTPDKSRVQCQFRYSSLKSKFDPAQKTQKFATYLSASVRIDAGTELTENEIVLSFDDEDFYGTLRCRVYRKSQPITLKELKEAIPKGAVELEARAVMDYPNFRRYVAPKKVRCSVGIVSANFKKPIGVHQDLVLDLVPSDPKNPDDLNLTASKEIDLENGYSVWIQTNARHQHFWEKSKVNLKGWDYLVVNLIAKKKTKDQVRVVGSYFSDLENARLYVTGQLPLPEARRTYVSAANSEALEAIASSSLEKYFSGGFYAPHKAEKEGALKSDVPANFSASCSFVGSYKAVD